MKKLCLFLLFLLQVISLSAKSMDIERYRNNSSVQWCWAISALYEIPFRGDELILDLGSGDGKITDYLVSQVPQGGVVGLDPLVEAINFAMDRYPNLTFVNDDAAVFSSPETYDLITAFCVFNWIEEKELVFAKMAENLKQGGHALIVVPCDLPGTESLYRELAQKAGLEILSCKRTRTEVVFQNSDELRQWLLSVCSDFSDEAFEHHLQLVKKVFPQAGDGRIYAFPHKLTILLEK